MITALSIGHGGMGRFANQAFTIASCIGIAIKSGQPYAFPRWQTHDNAAFGNPVDDIESHLLNELPRVLDIPFTPYGYFWGYRDINLPTGNWTIDAHMQSEKFFKHCMPVIRETFRFKDEPEQSNFVAIHYRAGDYTEGSEGHHPRCSREYYKEAMKLFPEGTQFHVFSDSHVDANMMFMPMQGEYNIHIRTLPSYIDDFKAMKKCHSFITANSSFSLFAAILGEHPDKKIVCPARWFGSQMPPEFGTEDIYPENSIII